MHLNRQNKCKTCNLDIKQNKQENRSVQCFLCPSRFHDKCRNLTSELVQQIKSRVVFVICDCCQQKCSSYSGTLNDQKQKEKSAPISRKHEICRNYLQGHCLYGENCLFGHTKICWNLIKTGSCLDVCVNRSFHENNVCEDSKSRRICLNWECDKFHISGTKRSERGLNAVTNDCQNAEHVVHTEVSANEISKEYPVTDTILKDEDFPELPYRGNNDKRNQFPTNDNVASDRRSSFQGRSNHANVASANTGKDEASQVKLLNAKLDKQNVRLQNNEKLVQQLMDASSRNHGPSSQTEANESVANHRLIEGEWMARIQNTEQAVNKLCAQFHQINAWLQNFQNIVKPQTQIMQLQSQPEPNQMHTNPVYHYPGFIPQVVENFGEGGPAYTPL